MKSDPLLLGFDTSAAHCAAALLCGGAVIASAQEEMARGQAERLMGLLQEVLAEGGAQWRDLAAIGVGIGPGNFTGIRISVSAARGLALGLGIPAVGVSRLEAMALDHAGPVVCALQAPRDMLYFQAFPGGSPCKPVQCGFDAIPWPDPRAKANAIGHRAAEIAQKTGGAGLAPAYDLPEAIARQASRRMQDAPQAPSPLYLRAADAAPSRDQPPRILRDPPA